MHRHDKVVLRPVNDRGYPVVRTIFLMTALALIMRVAAGLGTVEMAASHVINQYMMLMALGLDGFAHASEALAGAAWGRNDRARFRRWVVLTGYWSLIASLAYALLFWLFGNDITALLTDIESVQVAAEAHGEGGQGRCIVKVQLFHEVGAVFLHCL